jgi:hypothetical protein
MPGADGSYRGSRANNEQPSMIVLAARRGSMSQRMSAIRMRRRAAGQGLPASYRGPADGQDYSPSSSRAPGQQSARRLDERAAAGSAGRLRAGQSGDWVTALRHATMDPRLRPPRSCWQGRSSPQRVRVFGTQVVFARVPMARHRSRAAAKLPLASKSITTACPRFFAASAVGKLMTCRVMGQSWTTLFARCQS